MEKLNYAKHYLKWHSADESHYLASVEYYHNLLQKYLPPVKKIKILDVGCGMGIALYALRKKGYTDVMGIDPSKELTAIANTKHLPVQYVQNTIKWLNAHKSKFDVIILLDVLEHIPKKNELIFLRAIYESLKMGGKFICTVPNANSTFGTRWRYIDWTHEISFTEHSLAYMLESAHFRNVKIYEHEFFQKPSLLWLLRPATFKWLLFQIIRKIRRLEAVAEMGEEGKKIPLSLNILGEAYK